MTTSDPNLTDEEFMGRGWEKVCVPDDIVTIKIEPINYYPRKPLPRPSDNEEE